MPVDSEHFLNIFAKALNTFDPKEIASFYLSPTIFMNDHTKSVVTNEEKLEQRLNQVFEKFADKGIKKFEPKLQQTMRLSDSLFFSKVRWKFYDNQEQLCFSCAASYTLQKMPDKQLKIIVVVIDDDENKLTDIFSSAE